MANEPQDLNNNGGVPPAGTDPAGKKNDEGSGKGEEMVTVPKAEWEKNQTERKNLSDAVTRLNREKGNVDPKNSTEEGKVDAGTTAAATNDKDGNFEHKVKVRLQNRALDTFVKSHPEYSDETKKAQLLTKLRLTGDELTLEDFQDRIDESHLLVKRENGELDQVVEEQRKKAEQDGRNKAHAENVMSAGGVGQNRAPASNPALSPQGEAMAGKFKHDPKEVAGVQLQGNRSTIEKP